MTKRIMITAVPDSEGPPAMHAGAPEGGRNEQALHRPWRRRKSLLAIGAAAAGWLGSTTVWAQREAAEPAIRSQPVLPALLLAKNAGADLAVERYLVSEKLDGVRAYWTGRQMLHRSGAPIPVPDGFRDSLPAQPLDGELWLGRGRFEPLAALMHRHGSQHEPLWQQVRYELFELPEAPGNFAQRVAALQRLLSDRPVRGVQVAHQTPVASRAALDAWLADVVRGGGEGLMLHQADAPYVTGRSDVLLKLKPLEDAEAVVTAHLPGQGRHAGRLGALLVRSDDGRVFAIGSGLTDAMRDNPPPPGTVVVYRYRGLTNHGSPRFATFWRIRGPA